MTEVLRSVRRVIGAKKVSAFPKRLFEFHRKVPTKIQYSATPSA